ncbi:MAG: hypothetical protein Q4D98_11150 [Planctomycetia bacterium]|nr:hypothetical protein [Planctomycetia bacterium]
MPTLFLLFLCCLAPDTSAGPIVWFVHGMVTTRESFDEEIEVLKKTYPDAESVTQISWNSPKMPLYQMGVAWSISLENAEKFAPELAKRIEALPDEKRRRLILVGHSLGGRIAVRAGAILAKKGIRIRQLLLAGSAVNNDDPDIARAIEVSTEKVYNLINFSDGLLAIYKIGGEFHSPLGTGYLYAMPEERFGEIVMDEPLRHYGYMYLERYRQCVERGDFSCGEIVVPQDFLQADFSTLGGKVWWTEWDIVEGWRLQQNYFTGHCRILDPKGVRRAWGRKHVMEKAFAKVRAQLERERGPQK